MDMMGEAMPAAVATAADAPLYAPGRNCWRVAEAREAALLVDAGSYFAALMEVLPKARRQITVVGWDFDGRIRLTRDGNREHEDRLGDLLRRLVEAHPELEVRILVWSVAVVHAPSDPMSLLKGGEWQEHPRIHLKLDTHHPPYGSHHQKVAVIDDCIAFCGGIDMTVDRWDTNEHPAEDERRLTPDGRPYQPVHDMMMMVSGEAARTLGDLVRRRWEAATGEAIEPAGVSEDLWPIGRAPDFVRVPLAVARTEPRWDGMEGAAESLAMTLDMIESARRRIYIETQYFANFQVGEIMERHLKRADGPEIVVLTTHRLHGAFENMSMGQNRDRLICRLKQTDTHGRLRVLYPMTRGPKGARQVFLHAKLVMVDDAMMRVGSANLNNRSGGLDTECDLAIEARNDTEIRAIAAIRERLMAEHLGTEAAAIHESMEKTGSLIATIEALNDPGGRRSLRAFEAMNGCGPTRRTLASAIFDPPRPIRLFDLLPRWKKRA